MTRPRRGRWAHRSRPMDTVPLLVAQPSRGIDIAATQYIHSRLVEQRANGTAILVISEDLDELITLSDRILVMYEGSIISVANPRVSSREALGLMMAGVSSGERESPAM